MPSGGSSCQLMPSPRAIWMWSPTWAMTVCWLAAMVTRTVPGGGVGDGGPPDPATLPHAPAMAANATASSTTFMPLQRRPLRQVPGAGARVHFVLPPEFTPEGIGLAALIAAGTRDGIAIVGPDGKLVFWNSAAAAITGWSLAEAEKRNLSDLVRAPDALVEIRDGMWVELRYTEVESNGQTFLILMFTDSTHLMSLRDARQQLRSLGLIDETTGLSGRDLALVQLDQAIALARRDKRSVGVLTVKVDRFRQLRETADGEAVDEVVRQFAARIVAFVRGSDVPARVSNDSFLVILTALTSSNDAVIVAVRLLLVLAEPFDVVGEARSMHCSIGVAEFPRDASDATSLFGAAIAAADRAQLKGGGQYCVASEPRAQDE